jgi:D-galactose 1-dehydrogenase
MAPIRIGIVGVGKIARDQHLPAIAADPRFELVASASQSGGVEGLPVYPDIQAMLAGQPDLDAVSICTPPQVRHDIAQAALAAGKHVMLEKPPGATLSEVEHLRTMAERGGVSLFATWHSRHAPAVEAAREWLASRKVSKVQITWKEDVRHWHPGQEWIFEAGGLGVFDPAINALSIATRILPDAFFLKTADLHFPANRQAPIAAELQFQGVAGAQIRMDLDFLQTGPQSWDIEAQTDGGVLLLSMGGSKLAIDGEPLHEGAEREYPELYARFAELVARGELDVDVSPLRHVADAFMLGRRIEAPAFSF